MYGGQFEEGQLSQGEPLAGGFVNIVKSIDPRINVNQKRQLVVLRGPENTSFFPDNSKTFSNSLVTHSIKPAQSGLVESRLYLDWVLGLSFTGTASSGNLLKLGLYDGPRAFPLSQSISVASCQINGQQFSANLQEYTSALIRYINFKDENLWYSGCPSMPDMYQDMGDWTLYGSARNPLAFYGENSTQMTRGALQINVISNTGSAASLTMEIREPLMLSPFTWGAEASKAFANIATMNFQFNIGNLQRVWSHDNVNNPVSAYSLAVTINSAALLMTILTPNSSVAPVDLGEAYAYPYYNIVPNNTNPTSVSSGSSAAFNSGTVQMTSIPECIWVYCRQQNADLSSTTSDSFAVINQLTVQWQTKTGLLASATIHDLYYMALRNGLQDSFEQFSNFTGSVIRIDVARDLPLMYNEAVGMQGNYQFMVQANVTNTSNDTINYSLYVVYMQPGVAVISYGGCSQSTALITPEDIAMSQSNPFVGFEEVSKEGPYGGSFLSSITRALAPISRGIAKIGIPFGKELLRRTVGAVAGPAASLVAPLTNPLINLIPEGKGLRRRGRQSKSIYGKGITGGCMSCDKVNRYDENVLRQRLLEAY